MGAVMRAAYPVSPKDWEVVGSRSFTRKDRNGSHQVTVSPMVVMRNLVTEKQCTAVWRELASHKETHALLVRLANGVEVVHDLGTEVDLGYRADPIFPARVVIAYPDEDERRAVLEQVSWYHPDAPATYLYREHAAIVAHQLGGRLLTEAEWEALASDTKDPFIFRSLDLFTEPSGLRIYLWEFTGDLYGEYDPENVKDPTGAVDTDKLVYRGGTNVAYRAAIRAEHLLQYRSTDLGFRVRRTVPLFPHP